VTCCYATGEKAWIDDPSGISWETFFTTGESTVYGDGTGENTARIAHPAQTACCPSDAAVRSSRQGASACCAAEERPS
jgi:hypothetical protein